MVYVPWRLSSLEACHVSEEEWAGLRSTVIEALNGSTIGLEGPSVHGTAWDDWFEELSERVAREYWPKTDRVAVRRIFRPQVIEMAGVERGKRRAQRAGGSEDSDGGAAAAGSSRARPKREDDDDDEEMENAPNASTSTATAPRATTLPATPRESVNVAASSSSAPNPRAGETEDTPNAAAVNTLTPSEVPRRGPGRPKKPPVHSPPEQSDVPTLPKKHPQQNPHEEVNPTPPKRPRTSRAHPPPPWIAPRPLEPPSTASSTALGLILETRIPPSEKMKIIYASDTPTLALFLEKVRKKFHLSSEAQILGVEVEIAGGKTYVVDLEDGRDWLAVQEIARAAGTSAVGIVVETQSH